MLLLALGCLEDDLLGDITVQVGIDHLRVEGAIAIIFIS